jgi:hypothetical protein
MGLFLLQNHSLFVIVLGKVIIIHMNLHILRWQFRSLIVLLLLLILLLFRCTISPAANHAGAALLSSTALCHRRLLSVIVTSCVVVVLLQMGGYLVGTADVQTGFPLGQGL